MTQTLWQSLKTKAVNWRDIVLFGIEDRVHCMDALDLLSKIPTRVAGMVVIDPPAYLRVEDDGEDRERIIEEVASARLDDDIKALTEVAKETARVLVPGGSSIMLGDANTVTAWNVAAARAGLELMASITVLWSSRDRWRRTQLGDIPSNWVPVQWHVKPGHRHSYDPHTTFHLESNVLMVSPLSQYNRYHPVQRPVELFNFFISALTRPTDMIVDPFCGTGSALVAAKMNDRYWTGGDTDKHLVNIARRRVDKLDLEEMYLRDHKLKILIDDKFEVVEG